MTCCGAREAGRGFTEGTHMIRVLASLGMMAAGLMPLVATLLLLTQN